MIPFFDSTDMIYMHLVPTEQPVNKKYFVEVLSEFSRRFRQKRPALFKSGQWHFHQDNAPVHKSILVTDYLTKMGIKTVPQPPLLFVTFGYSLRLEAVVMRQLRRWKRLWRRSLTRSHKRTSKRLPIVVGTVQQEHFSRRRLLRRGLEFHVCTINKSDIRKKLWKLI